MLILQDSNDFSNIQLTPEQQRQLELIEKMPLLKETHPGETVPFVTPELGDPDIGKSIMVFDRCTWLNKCRLSSILIADLQIRVPY